ncbi:serine/threonine phosphatase Stp [Thermoclostridium stercorarium subsp. stercorarium DSM 8532]|uniref:Serine/threonine phosphatase Stp n=3 Tax=Thermoclostridium stercorarium TaxID=1510 RepID=L7VQF5_THES1|nr:Stp1/IreP family PP2C-type Ser/Thr phosphatase [Thermoclostridium stercorarium]AGC69037.1 serine/threonine phosphatase Stp [Thermoclostridium stercorarium subsp. stercorarium DSM 8532]AGI40012.1 serine-threonine phosphatase [Thermoclostridium stercorarium subsp. stercorarium DSM 8532]ANW99330.1 serine/threonine protein phosphatase [Thermoclostridium stercorarium subsp. thermolacticum DSM 2910]ANX01959.1 serine/threonine protein phosphatase [Thermoclostridium stercorarium subsp. leptospartum 
MEYAAISDKGIIREQNEDFWNIILDADGNPQAFIVADGMGGHKAGDIASKLAVESISNSISSYLETRDAGSSVEQVLQEAINKANEEIFRYSEEHLNGSGIGTTLTAGMLCDGKLIIAHIGDSSLYLVRNETIKKLTKDHSFVGELVDRGILDQEKARVHPMRNQITRALGYEKEVQVDFYSLDIMPDDIYLFCTDGLTMKLSADELLSMLKEEADLNTVLKNMVALANERGGDDNITAIVVKI